MNSGLPVVKVGIGGKEGLKNTRIRKRRKSGMRSSVGTIMKGEALLTLEEGGLGTLCAKVKTMRRKCFESGRMWENL